MAMGLGIFALILAISGQCQGRGYAPGPSEQDLDSGMQGSQSMPMASGRDQVHMGPQHQ